MQNVLRIILLPFIAAIIGGVTWAREESPGAATPKAADLKSVEYKRSDANYYLKSDIVKVNPVAVIVPKGGYTQQDDSYYFTPKVKAPKTLQFEVLNDWIEPITPPDAPPALSIPPDAMQVREPQGDVRVALPSAPGNFTPVAEGMPLVNGAVIKTGANATAAILFGGVCSARLMPNSAAAIQQTVTATSRTVEVDLTSGGVFSKVGQQVGVKGEYSVHTPFGNAIARGTDFVTITTPSRTDVWVAQGTVSLEPPDSKAGQMTTSDGNGTLKMMRFPPIADPRQALMADAETLTMIFDFVPMANQKIAALRSKVTRGETLTPGQQDYLKRIKQVPTLIKLAVVEKAPPPPPPAPAPTPTPTPVPKPIAPLATPVVATREPAAEGGSNPPPPMTITLGPGDLVHFDGANTTVTKLKARLAEIAKANPAQPLEIARDTSVGPILLKRVEDACHNAKLATKVLDPTPAVVTPAPALAPTPATATQAPTPAEKKPNTVVPAAPVQPATQRNSAKTPSSKTPSVAPSLSASSKAKPVTELAKPQGPIAITVNSSGTIKFRGETMSPAEFEPKLKQVVKATPDQYFVIEAQKDVPKEKFEAVLDICAAVGTKNLTMSILPSDSEPDKTPVPEVASPKALPVTESPKAKPVTEPAKAQGPLTVQVHINGSIGFKGVTITLLEFQTKLKALIKTTPDQELVIKSGAKVPYDKLKAVLDSCADAQVRHVTVASPSPTPPSVPESPAVNLPAPTLLMRPSMETMSSNAPPIAPTAPPPSGP